MQELHYERPETVAEATGLLARDGARILAGGTDLIPQLREGRRKASVIVDVKHIRECTAVSKTPDGGWRIGAGVSVGKLGQITDFAAHYAGLLASAQLIGSLQIQSRATLAGNLCNAAPSADAVPLLIAHGAEVEIASASGLRRGKASEIPVGPGSTSLRQGEFLAAILLPAIGARTASRYLRFTPRREMDIAIAGSAVRIDLAADGTISGASIVLASVAPLPLRAEGATRILIGQRPAKDVFEAASAKAAEEAKPISDTRGSEAYRRELVAVLTRRALADCAVKLGVDRP